MSAYVRLSLKAARQLKYILEKSGYNQPRETQDELHAAIAKAERTSARRGVKRKAHRAEREEHNAETAAIRAACLDRAHGRCEVCGSRSSLEMDHFFGRVRVKQSVESTWILCCQCHREKTDNKPHASTWLTHFIGHCQKHNYAAEREAAEIDLQCSLLKRGAR